MTDRWTWHGGGLTAARTHFGTGDQPWLDLSTGINPHAWPVPTTPIDWSHLPDERDLLALESAAARYFDVAPDHLCAVPGTEIGLRLVGTLLNGPTFHCTPSYRTHGEMLADSAPLSAATLDRADGATLILANPNNPDGRLLDHAALHDLLARRGQGWLLVDEAFADTLPDTSLAREVRADRHLILFRSFGKFFGLAGVRLGFVLGPPSFLRHVRDRLGAWPLSAPAIAIGAAAYADHAWIAAMRTRLVAEAAALDASLRRTGLNPTGACPLFRLLEVDDAHLLFEKLARRSILTRPFADNRRWLRIGLPPDLAACARLEQALAHG
ncbi:threonine-phosphate decarboxylase [Sphingobium sp. CR2-8]|uniref:threonine-phosphate decarboxylase n=1 Tax=Sphingobium sp. CR2-8 TaxID=1306534 RepID=UPI002DBD601B|nr:threonine-phosphate decarboxylase [Sphingobium sp. CR2-8]MEC3909815.1 threonine-phosphate decarboxylase [Sphingobium sp. CR2-8]